MYEPWPKYENVLLKIVHYCAGMTYSSSIVGYNYQSSIGLLAIYQIDPFLTGSFYRACTSYASNMKLTCQKGNTPPCGHNLAIGTKALNFESLTGRLANSWCGPLLKLWFVRPCLSRIKDMKLFGQKLLTLPYRQAWDGWTDRRTDKCTVSMPL